MRKSLIAVIAALCVNACLEVRYSEPEEVLEADRSSVTVVSERDIPEDENSYDQTIYDTLTVLSNRSFHASIEPAVDWVRVMEPESINLSGVSERVPVVLAFARNRREEVRQSVLKLNGETVTVSIPLTQSAPVYYIKTAVDKPEVLGVRDTCILKVRSNTKWTAAIDAVGTTAEVEISKVAGRDNGSLEIRFGMNDDFENAKTAVVVISAEGCEPQKVTVTQRDGSPFVTFLGGDLEVAPELPYIPLSITANVPWEAEILESTFVDGVIVTRESIDANPKNPDKWTIVSGGGYIEGGKYAYVGEHGSDPEVIKTAKLKVYTTDGTSSSEINITQRGCIHLDFLDLNPAAAGTTRPYWDGYNAETWPFEYPSLNEMCTTWNGCMLDPIKYPFDGHLYGEIECMLKCGYTMPVRTNGYEGDKAESGGGGFWYQKETKGLQLSYGINGYDYLKTPIVPGMALTRLIFEPSALGVNTVMVRQFGDSLDATILPDAVPGAVQWKYVNSATAYEEHSKVFEHVFQNPEKDQSYRLSFEQSTCMSSIKELVFIYE